MSATLSYPCRFRPQPPRMRNRQRVMDDLSQPQCGPRSPPGEGRRLSGKGWELVGLSPGLPGRLSRPPGWAPAIPQTHIPQAQTRPTSHFLATMHSQTSPFRAPAQAWPSAAHGIISNSTRSSVASLLADGCPPPPRGPHYQGRSTCIGAIFPSPASSVSVCLSPRPPPSSPYQEPGGEPLALVWPNLRVQ